MDVKTKALIPTHLSLGVSDLPISERFYRDVLGLPVRLHDGEAYIEFPNFLMVLTPSPPAGRGKFHFGFKVDTPQEVDAWAKRAEEHGAHLVRPSDRGAGRVVYINDPDEYVIEIYSE